MLGSVGRPWGLRWQKRAYAGGAADSTARVAQSGTCRRYKADETKENAYRLMSEHVLLSGLDVSFVANGLPLMYLARPPLSAVADKT